MKQKRESYQKPLYGTIVSKDGIKAEIKRIKKQVNLGNNLCK